jgi:hypothetical protein
MFSGTVAFVCWRGRKFDRLKREGIRDRLRAATGGADTQRGAAREYDEPISGPERRRYWDRVFPSPVQRDPLVVLRWSNDHASKASHAHLPQCHQSPDLDMFRPHGKLCAEGWLVHRPRECPKTGAEMGSFCYGQVLYFQPSNDKNGFVRYFPRWRPLFPASTPHSPKKSRPPFVQLFYGDCGDVIRIPPKRGHVEDSRKRAKNVLLSRNSFGVY